MGKIYLKLKRCSKISQSWLSKVSVRASTIVDVIVTL